MKKMTAEQEEKWNYIEKKISDFFWGIVAAAMILCGIIYPGIWYP